MRTKPSKMTFNPGDRVSFLDHEMGIREGIGGQPGKRSCIFGTRRRYTGVVISSKDAWTTIRPDEGQLFDAGLEKDGLHPSKADAFTMITAQASLKPIVQQKGHGDA